MRLTKLSPHDFELAWRLREQSWRNGELDQKSRLYEYTARVLVCGEYINQVYDAEWSSGSVGKSRLTETVQETLRQLFGRFG